MILEGDKEKARERPVSRAPVPLPGLPHPRERSTKRDMETTLSAIAHSEAKTEGSSSLTEMHEPSMASTVHRESARVIVNKNGGDCRYAFNRTDQSS